MGIKINFIKNEKGTVTIYLVIIFMAMTMLTGLFIDLARIKTAQNRLRGIANTSARSVLANYNTALRNEFGLFAVAAADNNKDFQKYITANLLRPGNPFNLMDYKYENSRLMMKKPLTDLEVLKRQILEDMKYTAPIELTRGLIDKLKPAGSVLGILNGSDDNTANDIDTEIKAISEINAQIKKNKEKLHEQKKQLRDINTEIEQLSGKTNRTKNDEARLSDLNQRKDSLITEIEKTKGDIQAGINASQDIRKEMGQALNGQDRNFTPDTTGNTEEVSDAPPSLLGQLRTYKEKFQNLFPGVSVPVFNSGSGEEPLEESESDKISADQAKLLDKIMDLADIEELLVNRRNEIYINEYALSRFTCLTDGLPVTSALGDSGEIEYILYGENSKLKVITELYNTRFALDTLAYFLFSKPPAPVDPLARTAYSLGMGALQAALDTFKLLTDNANQVAVAEMMPGNPLENMNLNLTYKDHLRLFMLLHNDETGKLKRIAEKIQSKIDLTQAHTSLEGSTEISIRLWFLPLAGFGNLVSGPFGTEIKNGRCYLAKDVEYSY